MYFFAISIFDNLFTHFKADYFLYFFLVSSLLYSLMLLREQALRRRTELLEAKVSKRTKQLIEKK